MVREHRAYWVGRPVESLSFEMQQMCRWYKSAILACLLFGVSCAQGDNGTGSSVGAKSGSGSFWKKYFIFPPVILVEGTVTYGEMIEIPAGVFYYGKDKTPIELPSFKIDKTEVTLSAYADCVNLGECEPPGRDILCDWFPPFFSRGHPDERYKNHPVKCVTWEKADKYCRWAGKRLPTEVEWEKAARGTDGRTYSWGDAEPTCDLVALHDRPGPYCHRSHSWPVCNRPLGNSPYGLCDMTGNVYEWTSSQTEWNGKLYHVWRGGSWLNDSDQYLAAYDRMWGPGQDEFVALGFRCVQ